MWFTVYSQHQNQSQWWPRVQSPTSIVWVVGFRSYHLLRMAQIAFLEEVVMKPLPEIKRLLKKSASITDSDTIPHIKAVQDERCIFPGNVCKVHRVFVKGGDLQYQAYEDVGWLVNDEIDNCLVCGVAFGMFCYKYYCWACGNIICSKCRPFEVEIAEIVALGPKYVCTQCCWGQVQKASNTRDSPNHIAAIAGNCFCQPKFHWSTSSSVDIVVDVARISKCAKTARTVVKSCHL